LRVLSMTTIREIVDWRMEQQRDERPGHEPRRVFCAVGPMPVLELRLEDSRTPILNELGVAFRARAEAEALYKP
jgi:hypothetical protein